MSELLEKSSIISVVAGKQLNITIFSLTDCNYDLYHKIGVTYFTFKKFINHSTFVKQIYFSIDITTAEKEVFFGYLIVDNHK